MTADDYTPRVTVHDFIPAYPGHRGEAHLLAAQGAPTCSALPLAHPVMSALPYVPGYAGHTSGPIGRVVRVVLHATVSACVPGGARGVANYFASSTSGGLAHYVVDTAEIIQCAPESLATWGAPPNAGEIHVELCDPQSGDPKRWGDPAHLAMLALARPLVQDICARHGLPFVFVDTSGLLAGHLGVTEHVQVSNAWHQTDHQDPEVAGPFPLAAFLSVPTPPPTDPAAGVIGAIGDHYRALGGTGSFLGLPRTPEQTCPDGKGRRVDFAGGIIWWRADLGAWSVRGAILQEYAACGLEAGMLGYPVSDEGDALQAAGDPGRYSRFERGLILWTYATGAHAVHGDIGTAFAKAGFEAGWGFPTGDEQDAPGGRSQTFRHGTALWNAASRVVTFTASA